MMELTELLGGPLGGGQIGVEAGQVAQFQQVGTAQAVAPQRHRPVPDLLGQGDHLGGHGQTLAGQRRLVGAPDGQVPVIQRRSQRRRVSQAPGQGDRLLAELQPAVQ